MPLDPNPVYETGVQVDKSAVKAYGVFRLPSKETLRNEDWSVGWLVAIGSDWFYRDAADFTSDDNDATIVVDVAGNTWKKVAAGVLAVHAAGTFSQRSSYNSQASPRTDGTLFIYLSTDGDGGSITDPVLFAKLSNGNSWSAAILFRGEQGGDRYEVFNWDTDRPATGEEIISVIFTTDVTFPAAFLGSRAKARVASTGTAVYSVRKNDVQIGTITFTASVNGVFAMATETAFAAGDRLSVVAPDPRDATLSGVVTTIVGTR